MILHKFAGVQILTFRYNFGQKTFVQFIKPAGNSRSFRSTGRFQEFDFLPENQYAANGEEMARSGDRAQCNEAKEAAARDEDVYAVSFIFTRKGMAWQAFFSLNFFCR